MNFMGEIEAAKHRQRKTPRSQTSAWGSSKWKEEVAALANQVQPLPQVVTELNYCLDECAIRKVAVASKKFFVRGNAILTPSRRMEKLPSRCCVALSRCPRWRSKSYHIWIASPL